MRRLVFSPLLLAPSLLAAATALPVTAQERRSPDVHFVPTPHEVVAKMLEVTDVAEDDLLYDLGSGDGRIVITAARKRGARGIGIDIDPERIRESRANARDSGVTELVEFRQADLFETDLSKATVVTLYLLPSLNLKLRPKLYRELRPGTRVVSNSFDMGDWKPDSTLTVGSHAVFYWMIPANAGGEWRLTAPGGREYALHLTQQFQRLEGRAERNGREVPLSRARVRGDRVELVIGDPEGRLHLEGRVDADSMTGTGGRASSASGGGRWTARRVGTAPPLGQETDD